VIRHDAKDGQMDRSGLRGKIAVVTGAAGGIGTAVCAALAGHEALVAAIDTNAAGLAQLASQLSGDGHKVAAYPADVTDRAAVDAAVDRIEADLGPVAVLANVAGVLRTGPILDMSDEDWAAVFAVNATGVFHVSRSVGRRMADRGAGSIITVASNAGGIPRMNMAAYGASKAASVMFTKCLGLELARRGVRCNVVSPGSTDTAMLRSMWDAKDADAVAATLDGSLRAYRVGIPLGKLAEPSDIAAAVIFLACDEAGHITMHDLYVDGGATLGA
jgi:2,3-dihydro-2,3-dihydroxybenzoate dehydrogenase